MTLLRRLSLLVVLTVTALGLTTAVVPVPAVAADTRAPTVLTLNISDAAPRPGETIWFHGMLTSNGIAMGRSTVVLQYRWSSRYAWRTVATTVVARGGSYSFPVRVTELGQYRTTYLGSSTHKPDTRGAVGYLWGAGRRALESRASVIGEARLGAPSSDILSTTVNGAPVRYQTFANGTLVEYGSSSKIRTWFVTGEANRVYLANGGPRGKFGVPVLDVKCGLIDSGCLQRFTGGSVYTSPYAQQTGISFATGRQSELIATAMSQAGYKAPSSNISRYNTWAGSNYAWCSIFLSWTSMASGNGAVLPVASRFSYFHSTALSWGRTGRYPAIGAIAFFDTHTSDGVSAATHAGLVYGYNANYIWTIEGNTTPTDGTSGRGVYLKRRTLAQPMYYAYPAY